MVEGCECEMPEAGRIRCQRHGCEKDRTQVELCQAGGKYWEAWEDCKLAGQDCFSGQVLEPLDRPVRGSVKVVNKPARKATRGGPGTELRGLLSMIGLRPARGCKCGQRMRQMNIAGCSWCSKNIETVVDWLAEEADRARLPFLRFAAKKIVRIAIRRALRKEKNSPPD